MKPLRTMVSEAIAFELESLTPITGPPCSASDVATTVREWYGAELDAAGIGRDAIEEVARQVMDTIETLGWEHVRRVLSAAAEREVRRAQTAGGPDAR